MLQQGLRPRNERGVERTVPEHVVVGLRDDRAIMPSARGPRAPRRRKTASWSKRGSVGAKHPPMRDAQAALTTVHGVPAMAAVVGGGIGDGGGMRAHCAA